MYKVFGHKESEVKDLFFTSLQSEVRKAINGLPTAYDPKAKTWGQAHT
jgi:hypothetical protein